MGIFSNLSDVLTGKTYKQNTLINDNISKIYKNAENKDPLYKNWTVACLASVGNLLEQIFIKDTKKLQENLIPQFTKENIDKLTPERVLETIKLIASFYLIIFTTQNNTNELFDIDREMFEQNIFEIFEVGDEDKRKYNSYKELVRDKKRAIDGLESLLAKLRFDLFRGILDKAFCLKVADDGVAVVTLYSFFHIGYTDGFMTILNKKIS